MAENYNKTRYFHKTALRNIIMYFSILSLILIFSFNCQSRNNDMEQAKITKIAIKDNENLNAKWDDFFEEDRIILFKFNDKNLDVYGIGAMHINSKGDYFILDGKVKKVIQFDESGKFIQYLGNTGEGPGEYNIVTCLELDEQDNLYLFDVTKMRINKYKSPNYEFEKQIRIGESIQDLIVYPTENFIGYTVSGQKVLVKFNNKGDKIQEYFTPKEEKLRLFLGRFHLGRFSEIGDGFLFIYPDDYKIYLLDHYFNLKKVFCVETPSKYFPSTSNFPNTLSPFSFSPAHAKWWSQSLRLSSIFYIGDQIFITNLIEYNNLSEKFFINIHDLNGKTYAKGLQTPFNGIIRYAKDGCVYVVEESSFDEKGDVIPLKLHCFKFKKNLMEKI